MPDTTVAVDAPYPRYTGGYAVMPCAPAVTNHNAHSRQPRRRDRFGHLGIVPVGADRDFRRDRSPPISQLGRRVWLRGEPVERSGDSFCPEGGSARSPASALRSLLHRGASGREEGSEGDWADVNRWAQV